MKTSQHTTNRDQRNEHPCGLRRTQGVWELTFKGRQATFKHELGALYVAFLLTERPGQALHGVALALKAREKLGQPPSPAEAVQQRAMGLEDASSVRALWRRQRELERVLEDRREIEPVKAEALRELEELTERLRQSSWLSCHGAERCAHAVREAIRRFHARLETAVDADGKPDEVPRAFALHLQEYLLVPSGRGGSDAREQAETPPGCFIYVPPPRVVWDDGQGRESKVQSLKSEVRHPKRGARAAEVYLSRFLCAGFALALAVTGCVGPRPLKGGKAVMTRSAGGSVQQTLTQSENPAQATKQEQESVKVRTYTVPAGSRVETALVPNAVATAATPLHQQPPHPIPLPLGGGEGGGRPGEGVQDPVTTFTLSAAMPVREREETRERTELGAAQKDMAREVGAKLASLKGIVWVGAGLFVFGLASLVYPPLKVVIGSVTTSAALSLGGLALMVLPSLIVGNELLILGVVALVVGGWFLAHRHGHLRGEVSSLKSKV